VSGLARAIRDLSLRGKVTLTLAAVFTGSVIVLLLALIPILREQRERLVEQDRRLLTTLRRTYERYFIYDLLAENRESLAVQLGALVRQEGVVWARIEAEGLDLPDLAGDPEAVLGRWVRQTHPEVDEAFARARELIEREMAGLEESLGALDPTLAGAAASARGRALHQVEGLREKSTRALKKRDEGRAARLRRAHDALFPGGSFQERGLGLIGAVARHGTALFAELRERVDPFARGHQVVRL